MPILLIICQFSSLFNNGALSNLPVIFFQHNEEKQKGPMFDLLFPTHQVLKATVYCVLHITLTKNILM